MRQTRQGINRITVDELGGQDAILVTIAAARVQSFAPGGDYLAESTADRKVVLEFAEFPGAEYVLNATSFRALADRYTNDIANAFRAWIRKPCVLVRVETEDPRTPGDKIQSVWVARPQQWTEAWAALAELEAEEQAVARPRRVARAKKSAAKKRK